MQSKNLIGAADLEWIFACNHEGLSLFFINIKRYPVADVHSFPAFTIGDGKCGLLTASGKFWVSKQNAVLAW